MYLILCVEGGHIFKGVRRGQELPHSPFRGEQMVRYQIETRLDFSAWLRLSKMGTDIPSGRKNMTPLSSRPSYESRDQKFSYTTTEMLI